MGVKGLFAILLLFVLPTSANARDCNIARFDFRFSSEGPWPVNMTVQTGKSCGSRQWHFAAMAKALYLKTAPHHGKVVLNFPGTYRYFPSAGYVGDDSFTLRICGTAPGGHEGCADLLFAVKVVSGSI